MHLKVTYIKTSSFCEYTKGSTNLAYIEIYYHDKIDTSVFEDVPPPSNNNFRETNLMRFNIDGFFSTAAGKEYLRDIANSLTVNMNSQLMKIVYHSHHETTGVSYKLCDFDDLKRKNKKISKHIGLSMDNKDVIFEELRIYSHKLYSQGVRDMYDDLIEYGAQFTNEWKKVKYKAKAIQRYYDEGGAAGRLKLTDMNRAENAKHQSYTRSRSKFDQFSRHIKLFSTGESISSLAKSLKMDRKTIRKYLLKINIMDKYRSYFNAKDGEETNALRGILLELQVQQQALRSKNNIIFESIPIENMLHLIKSMIYLYKPIHTQLTHILHKSYTKSLTYCPTT